MTGGREDGRTENADPTVRPLANNDEARECAAIMAASEPWITLRRDFDASLAAVTNPERETYVAVDHAGVAGFVVINMRGAFVGYLQSIAVRADCRSSGLGTRLIAFTEERIFRETPNVFLLVSSFNDRARRFYERLGYEQIGELKDFIVRGYSEILMRKTRGALTPG
jgi:ribosomal protein S18 acetylase RimI-like enzyme